MCNCKVSIVKRDWEGGGGLYDKNESVMRDETLRM
jgi:hypothetical protein